ncbi:MAG TPA: nucleoside-triphosphatase [Planctomycetota bacterium]|nr:nucleoside-triphosphatase [Planctomycetota bacterium]
MARYLLQGPERKTLLAALVEPLGIHARGFMTDPGVEEGEIVGYRMRSLEGREAWIAHISDAGPVRAGRFKVNVPEIDFVATESLKGEILPGRVFFLDEIGRLTLSSRRLENAIRDVFASGANVVATVEDRPHEFIEALRRLPGIETLIVTSESFSELRDRLLSELRPSRGL